MKKNLLHSFKMKVAFSAMLAGLLLKPALANQGIVFHDALTHLDSVKVSQIIVVRSLNDIRAALELAKSKGLKVSIAGQRHAQGGQQSYPNSIVLDMRKFNRIIALDHKDKIIRVQAGATWRRVQSYIQRYGLAPQVIPNRDFITIGGSLSSNIHGDDPSYGSIIETVRAFHLMTADGNVLNVSRRQNPELFKLVIGGYGLLGVILDAEISLTDNAVYKKEYKVMDYVVYARFVQNHILNNPNIGEEYAYFLKPDYFKTLRARIYIKTGAVNKILTPYLIEQKARYVSRIYHTTSRLFREGAMDTVIQEYSVPVANFKLFLDGLRAICRAQKGNINPVIYKIRYLKADKESFLPYTKTDSFGVSVDTRVKTSLWPQKLKGLQEMTRQIIALVLKCGGRFYLTKLAVHPDKTQLFQAYPEFKDFVKKKRQYDPQEIFMNQLYADYAGEK